MCGICGSTNDPSAEAVRTMNSRMVHRGPDDDGVHVDPSGVSLGARRLSIIDLEGGHQPVSNEDSTVWAALNGEIYNHPLLQRRLRANGHSLASGCDTEVLVHLWEEMGADLVHALEGMYAFCVWDARLRVLLLARDRFGEKPLFFQAQGGHLVFASELTALVAALTADTPEPLPEAVDEFFVFGYVSAPRSMLTGIEQLRPGHVLRWSQDSGQYEIGRYWRPPRPASRTPEPGRVLVEEAGALLRASVRSRLIADVPVGVLLSGGTDSALITALAAQEHGGALRTFTVGYEVGAVSEAAEAREIAHRLGTDHHEVTLDQTQVAAEVPELLAGLDQPQADQAYVAASAVARFARERVVVAVGGEGADELFGGYPRYRWLPLAERLAVLPSGVRGRIAAGLAGIGPTRQFERMLVPVSPFERHVDWVTAGRRHSRRDLYGPRLREVAPDHLLEHLAPRFPIDSRDVAGGLMTLDRLHYLPGDILAKADRASMVHSLEVRTPFLDRALAEFACALPASVNVRGKGKWILRELLRRVLPDADPRRKVAFRVPSAEWLRGPLTQVLEEELDGGPAFEEGWFDPMAVRRILSEHRAGADHNTDLWPILAFSLWLSRYRLRR